MEVLFYLFLANAFNLFLCMKKILTTYILLLVPHFLFSQIAAKETLYVENLTSGHWEIYNWVRKKVDSGEISWDSEISLRNLEQGLYILIIENNQHIHTSPLIKE